MAGKLTLDKVEFDHVVKKAVKRIPPEIRRHLKNVLISVRKRPSKAILDEMGVEENKPLLGMYRGTPLMDRSEVYPSIYPDAIILFQDPLEEMCETIEELEEQIEITVVHEIAHFLGISDERLTDLGYD